MNKKFATKYIQSLLTKNNLDSRDYSIEFKFLKPYRLGYYCHSKKSIVMNKLYLYFGPENEVIDTFRHEVAHILQNNYYEKKKITRMYEHCDIWEEFALELGARPSGRKDLKELNFLYLLFCLPFLKF